MRSHRISYVLTVLILCANCYGEGWTPELWETTNTWAYDANKPAYTNTSGVLTQAVDTSYGLSVSVTTNIMQAVSVVDVISQKSTTNYIPSLSGVDVLGYHEFSQSSSSVATYTNAYYTDIIPFNSDTGFAIPPSPTYSGATNVYSFTYLGSTQTLTTVVSRVESETIDNMLMDIDDQRQLELYYAVRERGTNASIKFYHNGYDNVAELKRATKGLITNYCNDLVFKDYQAITNWGSEVDAYGNEPLKWNVSNLCYALSLPTNYFDYTPQKVTDGVVFGYSTVTSCITIIRYPSVSNYNDNTILTNTLYLYDGTTTNVTGTNGQRVCAVQVYTNMADPSTNAIYSYIHMQGVMNRMTLKADTKITRVIPHWLDAVGYSNDYYNVISADATYSCSSGSYVTNVVTNTYPFSFLPLRYKSYGQEKNHDGSGKHAASGTTNLVSYTRKDVIQSMYLQSTYFLNSPTNTGEYIFPYKGVGRTNAVRYRDFYLFSQDSSTSSVTKIGCFSTGSRVVSAGINCSLSVDPAHEDQELQTNTYSISRNTGTPYPLRTGAVYGASGSWSNATLTTTPTVQGFLYSVREPFVESNLVNNGMTQYSDWSVSISPEGDSSGQAEFTTTDYDTQLLRIHTLIDLAITNGFTYY